MASFQIVKTGYDTKYCIRQIHQRDYKAPCVDLDLVVEKGSQNDETDTQQ